LLIFPLRSTAGNWLFCNRRWLNPLDREDRQTLDHNYDKLCLVFPAFARCSKATFIHVLMDVSISWSDRIKDGVRRTVSPSKLSSTPSSPSGARWPEVESCPLDEVELDSGSSGAEEMEAMRWDSRATSPQGMGWSEVPSSSATGAEWSVPGYGALATGRGVLNAGEAVDMKLHEHWACVPTLRIEASELERFGRSKSF
jgi:hypothetical protein